MGKKADIAIRTMIVSPGIIDGEVHLFLEDGLGAYYVKRENDEEYMRQDGKFVRLPLERCIEARERYMLSHGDQEKEDAIQREMTNIINDLKAKALEIIETVELQEEHLSGEYKSSFMQSLIDQEDHQHIHKKRGQKFFEANPDAVEIKMKLQGLLKQEDYDSLYQLFNKGPVMSVALSDVVGMAGIKAIFSADNIDKTLDELKEPKGTIRLAARAKVEKYYN